MISVNVLSHSEYRFYSGPDHLIKQYLIFREQWYTILTWSINGEPTIMKFLYDYFPIICFFVGYKIWGIYTATAITMVASILQVGVFWFKHHRFEKLHLITLGFVILLGGSTLLFHKAIYIKWKPSIIYWVFAIVLLGSQFIGSKTVLHRILGDKINVPIKIWTRLNIAWGIFFALLGCLNLYVVYNYSTNAWVNFKLFGTLGLLLVFAIGQAFYMARYMKDDKKLSAKK